MVGYSKSEDLDVTAYFVSSGLCFLYVSVYITSL